MLHSLDTEAALRRGLDALAEADPVVARMRAEAGTPPLRKRDPGFRGLAAIVVSQQLSTASAAAIRKRIEDRFPDFAPERLLAASDEDLRACGLSAPKIRTLRAVAEAAAGLPLEATAGLPAEEIHARLVAIKGVGPWTADIYLLFCLGHADAFPAGDLALQEAARIAYGLNARPGPKELFAIAERWRPWRGVAAKLLWAYYGVVKGRNGVPTTGASG